MAGLHHGWGNDPSTHADFRHNGVPVDDFEETFRHKKASRKKRPNKKRGCPENNYGPHVYVWVPQTAYYDWWPEYIDTFYERNGFYRRDVQVCCGCNKKGKSRYTEEMQKRIAKMGWYKANY